jgi:hypothetical protein
MTDTDVGSGSGTSGLKIRFANPFKRRSEEVNESQDASLPLHSTPVRKQPAKKLHLVTDGSEDSSEDMDCVVEVIGTTGDGDNGKGKQKKKKRKGDLKVESNESEQATRMEILQALREIKLSQDSLKMTFEARLEAATKRIEESVSALREDIYMELGLLESKVKAVEERLDALETSERSSEMFPVDTTVVVINLREEADEVLDTKCDNMLSNGMGLRGVKPLRCTRLAGRDNKPGVVKIQLQSKEDKIKVLRSKAELSKMPGYKRVFVRSAQSHEERMAQMNLQTLLRELPHGQEYRFTGSGRLVKRDFDTGPQTQYQQQQRQQHISGFSQQGRQQESGSQQGRQQENRPQHSRQQENSPQHSRQQETSPQQGRQQGRQQQHPQQQQQQQRNNHSRN